MSTAVLPDLSEPRLVAHTSTPEDIFGWFDFAAFYDAAVETAPPGSALVEVGVFLGKSLCYLGERAQKADKGLRVYGVDRWRGSAEFDGTVWLNGRPVNQTAPGDVLAVCYDSVCARGLADVVTLVTSDSTKAANIFADGAVHMAFLDAAHDERSVSRDAAAWWPKVAPGGWLAGHDYRPENGFPGVKAAVDRAFGAKVVSAPERSWWEVRKT